MLRQLFDLDERGVTAVAAVSITTPTLAFILTFNTLAYGVGIGFLAVALSFEALRVRSTRGVIIALALGAFAIGIYQPFAVVLAIVASIRALTASDQLTLRHFAFWLAYVVGCALLYLGIGWVVLRTGSFTLNYVNDFFDFAGLLSQPGERIGLAAEQLLNVTKLHPAFFAASSVWLSVTVAAAASLAILHPLLRRDIRRAARNGVLLAVTVVIVVLAGAISPDLLPLRSLIYFPVAVAVVLAVGYAECVASTRALLVALGLLCIVGNSSLNNHLFASSASAEFQDRLLARDITRIVRDAYPDIDARKTPVKVVTIGSVTWPETPTRTRRDTFGASFFGWGGGHDVRVAAYLTVNGLNVTSSTPADRLRVHSTQARMPAWPRDGWIVVSGDTVVLKFGEYTATQRTDLCELGERAMCTSK
jgi:hypothetical protein